MTSTRVPNRRDFPSSIRADLAGAVSARRRQLSELTPLEDPGDLVAAAHRNAVARLLSEALEALERLGNGTYGDCQSCHAPIPLNRLVQRPWATHCTACPR